MVPVWCDVRRKVEVLGVPAGDRSVDVGSVSWEPRSWVRAPKGQDPTDDVEGTSVTGGLRRQIGGCVYEVKISFSVRTIVIEGCLFYHDGPKGDTFTSIPGSPPNSR